MKVHLVDGTYELFRAFYGGRPRKGPDGREVGATQQLMRSMLVLLSEPDVSHVGLA
ncbi:MAG TPA: flap endonuclease, partial [Polyangiaceae bacterium]|nr:flap endonuclease [Polyangiaceae bacterium]